MFRNYLSYQMALSFHRGCLTETIPEAPIRHRLLRSTETLIHQFSLAVRVSDRKAEARHLVAALYALRDCHEILDEAAVEAPELRRQWGVLHARMERLCEDAAGRAEGGQLRMLG